MEFRARDYLAEESAVALPRLPAHDHPLALRPSSSSTPVDVVAHEKFDFNDPLRAHTVDISVSTEDAQFDDMSRRRLSDDADCLLTKEWKVFTSFLMQKFSCSSTIPISLTLGIGERDSKEYGKSLADIHMEELDDPDNFLEVEKKVVTCQEYASRLQELKGEIGQAWRAGDHVKSLKLSIKVARLLMDTTVLQFYPMLFILVIDVLDMLGDLVWNRIKRKAEHTDSGTFVCSLPENFVPGDICSEAKDTCYNWFCKIGSIRELLPRIYLELAILRCWQFLEDHHLCNIRRLTMMMRGLADPLASAYCHLYLARCAGSLHPKDRGYLITSICDISTLLGRIAYKNEFIDSQSKSKAMLIPLVEPTIEWIMKCIFVDGCENPDDFLLEFGFGKNMSASTSSIPSISVVIYHLLKQLPAEFISTRALEVIELIEKHKDVTFDQHLNYKLLGLKLSECPPLLSSIDPILEKVTMVLPRCNRLVEYLIVADAYLDIILHYSMVNSLFTILDGVPKQAPNRRLDENEMDVLQSILIKIINHFGILEDTFSLKHLMRIIDLLHGSSRDLVNVHLLTKATRIVSISDPTTIELLFEISQALHESMDTSHMNDDYQQIAGLISHFVQMVDFGAERERHLAFLIECRAAFACIDELKGALVHLSNTLAVKAIKSTKKFVSFLKACIAFNEVTIPSIPADLRRMSLYLGTAEVALFGGLVSHAAGLVNSAVSCLECINMTIGSQNSIDGDQILSLACKLCSILVLMPGIHEEGVTFIAKELISLTDCQSLMPPRIKIKIHCAVISLSAGLSQTKLIYHARNVEVVGNDQLFYGDTSHYQELLSVADHSLQTLINVVEQEPHLATRRKLALDACNCLIVSFKANHELHLKCSRLIKIAKSCGHLKDKYLECTVNFFDKHLSNS